MVLSPGRRVNAESAANRFAGAFLMPAEALWSEVGKRRHSIGLGGAVRLEAAVRRQRTGARETLPRFGHLRANALQRLSREFGLRGWSKPPFEEPLSEQKDERPRRFERLCLRALAEGVVSEPKAAELLNVTIAELNRRMEEPPD